ncbi:MAG: respiratory nitrate reductase subunit gamma [Humidesulfovibrio sp.]|nr:respiratory nitrate reductase subunit gamma [Humidesulfovibrio sp.]
MATLYYLILAPMVYLAVAVSVLGTLWRIARLLRAPAAPPPPPIYPSRKPSWLFALGDALLLPSVFKHNAPLWAALGLFHLGLAALFLGHLELVADFKALQLIPHSIFLGKGLIGLTVLVCLMYFLCRRMVSPTKELSVPEDYLLLVLLLFTVLFGAQMDWARTWFGYSSMGVDEYRGYLSSLIRLKPSVEGVTSAGHSFMLVAHVFFANLLIMAFPFTKLMHAIFTFAMNKFRRG